MKTPVLVHTSSVVCGTFPLSAAPAKDQIQQPTRGTHISQGSFNTAVHRGMRSNKAVSDTRTVMRTPHTAHHCRSYLPPCQHTPHPSQPLIVSYPASFPVQPALPPSTGVQQGPTNSGTQCYTRLSAINEAAAAVMGSWDKDPAQLSRPPPCVPSWGAPCPGWACPG